MEKLKSYTEGENPAIKNLEYDDFQASAKGQFDFVTGLAGFTSIDGLPRGILSVLGMFGRAIFGADVHANLAKDEKFGNETKLRFENNKQGNDIDNGKPNPIK